MGVTPNPFGEYLKAFLGHLGASLLVIILVQSFASKIPEFLTRNFGALMAVTGPYMAQHSRQNGPRYS
jgi:hypothetical protein